VRQHEPHRAFVGGGDDRAIITGASQHCCLVILAVQGSLPAKSTRAKRASSAHCCTKRCTMPKSPSMTI
jgi:hypothetical protein